MWENQCGEEKKCGEQEPSAARKFLCLAAQGNIDLTCNYWKGTRFERGSGHMKQSGKDVASRRQPRSVTVYNKNEIIPRLSGSVTLVCTHLHFAVSHTE